MIPQCRRNEGCDRPRFVSLGFGPLVGRGERRGIWKQAFGKKLVGLIVVAIVFTVTFDDEGSFASEASRHEKCLQCERVGLLKFDTLRAE